MKCSLDIVLFFNHPYTISRTSFMLSRASFKSLSASLISIELTIDSPVQVVWDVPAPIRLSRASKSGEAAPAVTIVTITARMLATPPNMLLE